MKLKNGEISNDVQVKNAYMNAVSELEVTNIPDSGLNMKVGETKEGIQVFGKTEDPEMRPELTMQEACLAIDLSEPGIVSLRRDETIGLRADKAGSTTVTFALRDVSPAIAKVVPVTVQDADLRFLSWLQKTKSFAAKVSGDLTCKYRDDGSTVPCAFLFNNTMNGAGLAPVEWTGESFTISGTIQSPVSGKCELDAAGSFNPGKKTLAGHFKTTCVYTKSTTKRTEVTEFTLGELPPLLGVVPEKETGVYVFMLSSLLGDPASLIKSRVALINYTETHTTGGPVRTSKFDSANWDGQIILQMDLGQ